MLCVSRKVPWISLVSKALCVSKVLLTIFVSFSVVLVVVVITWTQVAYIVLCAPCIRVYEVPWIYSGYRTVAHPLVLIYGSSPECSKLCSVTYTLLHSTGKSMCFVFYSLRFTCLFLTRNLQIQSRLSNAFRTCASVYPRFSYLSICHDRSPVYAFAE